MNTFFVLLLTLATALVLFLWLSPANIAYFLRRGMPFALIGLGALLLVLRQTALGSLALFVGITWLRRAGGVGSFGPRAPLGNKTQQSTVRSAALALNRWAARRRQTAAPAPIAPRSSRWKMAAIATLTPKTAKAIALTQTGHHLPHA